MSIFARYTISFLIMGLFTTLGLAHEASDITTPHIQTAASQAALTPKDALEKLKDGNMRFIEEQKRDFNYTDARKVTSIEGQHPFALIFSCIDSRSTPEITFDQGVGNIFTARVAGNVIGTNVLGSIEYAIQYVGSKLIVIMGHTQCGAMGAACTGESYGNNLNHLLLDIKPAVSTIVREESELNCSDPMQINAIAKQNVLNQMQNALFKSTALREMNDSGDVLLVGALHNIKTGEVAFFDIDGEAL